ncbi:hypothetical protein [Sphaerisporangium album]|nr:hypothetical protein [Sphaerisporangium album]
MPELDLENILKSVRLQDGGLVEIHVLDTSFDDWAAVVTCLQEAGYVTSLTYAGQRVTGGLSAAMFTEGHDAGYTLEIKVGEQQTWTTGLYSEDAIDLQGDPRSIKSSTDLTEVVGVMNLISTATGKTVVLLPETLDPKNTRPYLAVQR